MVSGVPSTLAERAGMLRERVCCERGYAVREGLLRERVVTSGSESRCADTHPSRGQC